MGFAIPNSFNPFKLKMLLASGKTEIYETTCYSPVKTKGKICILSRPIKWTIVTDLRAPRGNEKNSVLGVENMLL